MPSIPPADPAKVTMHLALALARRGGGIGAAALCGGGQGEALLLRVPDRAAHAQPTD